MLLSKIRSILVVFAFVCLSFFVLSNASAQDVQMAQLKEDVTVLSVDTTAAQQEEVYPDLPVESVTINDEYSGFDLMLGIGFTNFYALPGYFGASYQFVDFYRMMVDIKIALLAQFMVSANWMHMFEFFSNEHIALSVGAGIGYLAIDKITLRFDGSYDDDDDDFKGKRGMVFPATFAFDWHTSKDVSLRAQVDLNNYYVIEDRRDNRCKVPRYEFHYDVILQAVIHI